MHVVAAFAFQDMPVRPGGDDALKICLAVSIQAAGRQNKPGRHRDRVVQVHGRVNRRRRIVVLEFPSVAAWEAFYNGPVYQGLKAVRDECSTARLVAVEGIDS